MAKKRRATREPSQEHDLQMLLQEATDDLSRRYMRIQSRVLEDPGTAGDQGEENWAELLRSWLPSTFPVVTKGRLLSVTNEPSPQLDVLVLRPSYPHGLLQEKLYLATGVLAAFECKLTFRPQHLPKVLKTSALIKALTPPKAGDLRQEVMGSPIYGVLAHSHVWHGDGHEVIGSFSDRLFEALTVTDHPRNMVDLICISDLATWAAVRSVARQLSPDEVGGVFGSYCSFTGRQRIPLALGPFLERLLGLLSFEDESLSWLSEYFAATPFIDSTEYQMHRWPLDTISARSIRRLESTGDLARNF